MKGLAMLALCAVVLLTSGHCAAREPRDELDVLLERMAGTWYDEDGGTALTIGPRMINGCPVVGWGQWVGGLGSGGAEFRVEEAGGERTLHIGWRIFGGAGDYVTLDGSEALQRTLHPAAFESVGGVHFGMRLHAVQEILGEGVELSEKNPCQAGGRSFSQGLYYANQRLIVFHESGIVTGLVLLKGSKLRFDRSGLAAGDSREKYARAYDLSETPEESSSIITAAYGIAPGENLFFGKDGSYVVLSVYDN